MSIPPVFDLDDLTRDVIDDIRDASATYWSRYKYTQAFDDLILERKTIADFLSRKIPGRKYAEVVREKLARWGLPRPLSDDRIEKVGHVLGTIRKEVAVIPSSITLETADPATIKTMVGVVEQLCDCPGVVSIIASKLLAPLQPALFPIWDRPIAERYGFAPNAAGYRRFLNLTQDIARKTRSLWPSTDRPLDEYLKPEGRKWTAPLAKLLDEWNWIRITRAHPYPSAGASK